MAFLGPSLRRRKVGERPAVRVAAAIVASLVLNALAGWLLVERGVFAVPSGAAVKPVVLAPLTADQWNANRALAGAERRLPAPVPPPPVAPPPKEPEHQGVFTQLPPMEQGVGKTPKDARYLSEKERAFEKETVSRFAGNTLDPQDRRQEASPGRKASGEEGRSEEARTGREGNRPREGSDAARRAAPARPPRDALALAPGGDATPPPPRQPTTEGIEGGARALEAPGTGEDGKRAQGPRAPDLSLGPDTMAKIAGGPGLAGYREVEEGEETRLNTWKDKNAGFMGEVSRAVASRWSPKVQKAIQDRDPDGSSFFFRDRTVVLDVQIDRSGRLKEVAVLRSSNVDFFDRIAVDAVQRAQPFPPAPSGIPTVDGSVRFAYTFTLYGATHRTFTEWRPMK